MVQALALARTVVALLLVTASAGALAGCIGQSTVSSTIRRPVVFVDSTGQCPRRPTSRSPAVCRATRYSNAVAGTFATRHTSWGVTYAFNCGRAPGKFIAHVGLPSLDGQLPATDVTRYGIAGDGVRLMTPEAITGLRTIPTFWRSSENIEITSTCAWHVRAIAGGIAALRSAVPSIPAFKLSPPYFPKSATP